MRFRRIVPTSAAGRATTAVAAVLSVTAGITLAGVGMSRSTTEDLDAATVAQAPPVAVVRPATAMPEDHGGAVRPSDVRLIEYNPAAKRAVLAWTGKDSSRKSTIKAGDIVASPPTAKAPNGALFKVGEAIATDAGIEIFTEPATLSDALGQTEVSRTIEASALEMTVTPLAAGVRPVKSMAAVPKSMRTDGKAPRVVPSAPSTPSATPSTPAVPRSAAAGPATTAPADGPTPAPSSNAPSDGSDLIPGLPAAVGKVIKPSRTADGGLLLAVDVPLDGVAGVTGTGSKPAKLAGWVGLTPKLVFSFGNKRVDGANPFQAQIGVGGSYQYGWQVNAKLNGLTDTGEKELRVPFADVRLRETIWVGPIPIVLSVDLTYFYRLTADGTLSIDTQQSTKGEFALGAMYDSRTGWGPLNRNDATTVKATNDVVTGRGDFRATIGADLKVMLYDAVGVSGRLAPYLRATVDATAPPKVFWGIYAGFDLTGGLNLDLKIFGITILKKDLDFPPLHAEWRVASSTPPPQDRSGPVAG